MLRCRAMNVEVDKHFSDQALLFRRSWQFCLVEFVTHSVFHDPQEQGLQV